MRPRPGNDFTAELTPSVPDRELNGPGADPTVLRFFRCLPVGFLQRAKASSWPINFFRSASLPSVWMSAFKFAFVCRRDCSGSRSLSRLSYGQSA